MMFLWEKQALFAQNIASLLQFINSKGMHVTLGEVFRTAEQATIYAQTGKGIVNSLHCKRLAVDINLIDNSGHYIKIEDPYEPFGEYWETLHRFNRWGGRFTRGDACHFEMQDL